jgi:hypothetical protein
MNHIPMFFRALIALLICLGAAALAMWWMGTRCWECLYRRARLELGGKPICPKCLSEIETAHRIAEGVMSDMSDMERRELEILRHFPDDEARREFKR